MLLLPLVQGCRGWEAVGGRKLRQLFLQWGVRTLSVSPTQVQLKRVILSSQCHLRSPAMETSSEGNRGAEGPHPGLDCTGCSDKTTGKGRLGQGNWLAGATVTPGRAHSSIRSPATPVEARIWFSHAVPPARSWELVTNMRLLNFTGNHFPKHIKNFPDSYWIPLISA